jgi:hypothetical protein
MPVSIRVVAEIDGSDTLTINGHEWNWSSSHARPDLLTINGVPFAKERNWSSVNPYMKGIPPDRLNFATAVYYINKKGPNSLVDFRADRDGIVLRMSHPPNGFGSFDVTVIYFVTCVYVD